MTSARTAGGRAAGATRPAAELTNNIIEFIYRQGGYAWRASSVGVYDQNRHSYRTAAKKGVSDILACYRGILLAIEVKIGTDRPSPEQEGFLANVRAAGGLSTISHDFEEFTSWWNTFISPLLALPKEKIF
jgi:hypothetical protein